jgi:hypothetical protein
MRVMSNGSCDRIPDEKNYQRDSASCPNIAQPDTFASYIHGVCLSKKMSL